MTAKPHEATCGRPAKSLAATTDAPLIAAVGVGKSFGGAAALRRVDIAVRAGEVRAVLGENGAGKSTLMKLLAGVERPDEGRVELAGETVTFADAAEAERRGIVLVHQEQMLATALTVAENLFLGRERRRGPLLDRAAMRAEARDRLRFLGCDLSPEQRVSRLSIAERQLVQMARVLLVPRRVVILDEPTAVLTPGEVDAVVRLVAHLKAGGVAVLYISHRLSEIGRVADRVTVLRDGVVVAERDAAALTELEMARLMVGRPLSALFPPKVFPDPVVDRAPALAVSELAVSPAPPARFHVRAGEIVGFGGLVGAGRTELFEGLVGLRPAHARAVRIDGVPLRARSPRAALAHGLVYLTEDRKGKGLLLDRGIPTNITLARPPRRFLLLDGAREATVAAAAVRNFDIRTRNPAARVGALSGGNQQKVMLAKAMLTAPRVLVVDEPTRGIDIGTKVEIYLFLARLAAAGTAVVVISSEMQELIGLCHRVMVMRRGRIVAELPAAQLTEHDIVVHATGVGEMAA